ncbi:MAG: hypothetical protein IQL11_08420 [Bacteroidales bacterium]|nr:hypothetical protein [Bacteroidales bacterium]
MKSRTLSSVKLLSAVTAVTMCALTINAYSQKSTVSKQNTGAVTLEYKFLNQTPLKYLTTSKMIQIMDFQGQSMQNNINSVFGCSVKAAGKKDRDLVLEIKADTLGQTVESPMGTSGGSISAIKDKVFNVTLSPDGRQTDISEAAKVVYFTEGSGESDLSQTFLEFFPILPLKPVKPGDTWNTVDTIAGKSASMSTTNVMNSDDKLEGIEVVDGVECARISSVLSGTMTINTQNQGMDIRMHGTYTGTGTLLFAIKEGYFVKQTSTTKVTGNIEISGAENMTFPVVMDVTSVNEVKK